MEDTGQAAYYMAIGDDLLPTPEQSKDMDAVEQVVFVGYPNGIYDTKNLLPIIRRGTTATPFQIDYEGQPVFLIDASVFPGSSGSPVFIAEFGGHVVQGGLLYDGRLLFLGIIAEVAVREERGRIDFEPIPTAKVPVVKTSQMIDLGVVYKSSAVQEAVTDLLDNLLDDLTYEPSSCHRSTSTAAYGQHFSSLRPTPTAPANPAPRAATILAEPPQRGPSARGSPAWSCARQWVARRGRKYSA